MSTESPFSPRPPSLALRARSRVPPPRTARPASGDDVAPSRRAALERTGKQSHRALARDPELASIFGSRRPRYDVQYRIQPTHQPVRDTPPPPRTPRDRTPCGKSVDVTRGCGDVIPGGGARAIARAPVSRVLARASRVARPSRASVRARASLDRHARNVRRVDGEDGRGGCAAGERAVARERGQGARLRRTERVARAGVRWCACWCARCSRWAGVRERCDRDRRRRVGVGFVFKDDVQRDGQVA